MFTLKRRRSRVLAPVLATALLSVIAACSAAPSSSTGVDPAQGTGSVRTIKTTPNLLQLPLLYALKGGLFSAAGVEVQEEPDSNNSTAPIQSLLAGQVDVVFLGGNSMLAGIAAGQDLVAVGMFAPANSYQVVVSTKVVDELGARGITPQSPVAERVAALRGLTIASNGPGNSVDSVVRATLTEYGLAPDRDVTLRPIPDPSAMLAAFRQGQVDGFVFGPPNTSLPVVEGIGAVWVDYARGDVPSLSSAPTGLIVTTKRYAAAHRTELVGVNKAMVAAYRLIGSDPQKVRDTLAPAYFPQLQPALLDAGIGAVAPMFTKSPVPTEEGYRQMLTIYNADESIKKKLNAPFDQVFDPSFAQQATAG